VQHLRSLEHCILLSTDTLEEQLLRPFNTLIFSDKFHSSLCLWTYDLICELFCFFYLLTRKSRWQICRFDSGILLHSAECLNIWMIILCLQSHWEFPSYEYICGFGSLLRFVQNSKTFQITDAELYAVLLNICLFYPKCCIVLRII